MSNFTFFTSFVSVDCFLEFTNYTKDYDLGNGLCENLDIHSSVLLFDRRTHDDYVKNETFNDNDFSLDRDGMSISSNCGAVLSDLFNASVDESDASSTSRSTRKPLNPSYKDEFLVCCLCAKHNILMRRTGSLFVIGATLVHVIVSAWENVLCVRFKKFFPASTSSHILRACPKIMIQKFGYTSAFMILDATEAHADVASMNPVDVGLHSAYKNNSTMKCLVRCDPIRIVWDESIILDVLVQGVT